ncbi:Rv3235 family protein [Nocardioides sp. AX2bis]|uniref:Rv3235 family protein n=1 Tax=Nocardioides sp. AX2bis TaxID=2653157 RepID=UPI0012F21007|nr:Rv3235 family protein [Nocardioides sp. AX2bis]VXB12337.1 conserved hypothetical protein [Nocardioides sp. AX2bis]
MSSTVVPIRPPVPVSGVQGTLALALLPRREPPPTPVVPPGDDGARSVEAWARRVVQAALEIVGGDRPASQLVRWVDREVLADLQRRAWLVAHAGGHTPGVARVQPVRPRVLSVHSCVIADGVVDAAVHAAHGPRSRAVATRFERRRGRWVCTALDFS